MVSNPSVTHSPYVVQDFAVHKPAPWLALRTVFNGHIYLLRAERPASPVAPMNLPRQRRRGSRHLVHAFVMWLSL
jgi:hypothetical protein